jgi:hypothetical protein
MKHSSDTQSAMSGSFHRWAPLASAAVGGAFCSGTLCWIVWGVLTPGDYFANGNAFVNPSLVLAAVAGAWFGFKARTQLRIGTLAILGVLCVVFWIATPTGWWAKPLPGSRLPGTSAHH